MGRRLRLVLKKCPEINAANAATIKFFSKCFFREKDKLDISRFLGKRLIEINIFPSLSFNRMSKQIISKF